MQIGFLPLLTLVFVAAKLFGAIAWSWWWVLAPMWGWYSSGDFVCCRNGYSCGSCV